MLSLAEVDKAMRDVMGLDSMYSSKPVLQVVNFRGNHVPAHENISIAVRDRETRVERRGSEPTRSRERRRCRARERRGGWRPETALKARSNVVGGGGMSRILSR